MLPCLTVGARVPGRTGAGVPACSPGNALSSVQTGVEATDCTDAVSYTHLTLPTRPLV